MSRIEVKLHKLEPRVAKAEGFPWQSFVDKQSGYWHGRVWAQLEFANQVSHAISGKWDDLINEVLDDCLSVLEVEGCLPSDAGKAAEAKLKPIGPDAKTYTIHLAGHSHMDMVWMWPFDETVALVIDTFRSVLELMDEYPDFVFMQSQAFVYKIVEKYGPTSMLDEIRRRVHEGRWRVTAGTWVEADKNMTSGESMARQILYAKNYLSKLLDISKESINIDWEPDTFGTSAHVPEVLRNAGIPYYMHGRGPDAPQIHRFRAPSGAEVLAWRGGGAQIVAHRFLTGATSVCTITGGRDILWFFGLGDHGAGPTRRDLERIADMRTWPVYPTIVYGFHDDFFKTLDINNLSVFDREINPKFSGCYSSQSRIKKANRVSEVVLSDLEAFAAFSGYPYPAGDIQKTWEKVLLNQFHDIVTGAGLVHTREFALGQFQEIMAVANTRRSLVMRSIADRIDTARYIRPRKPGNTTEGAGAGFGVADRFVEADRSDGVGYGLGMYRAMSSDRSVGLPRVYTLFNSAPFPRDENILITVWDWKKDDVGLFEFRDAAGMVLPHQLLDYSFYDCHTYAEVLVRTCVPAMGWTIVLLDESADTITHNNAPEICFHDHKPMPYILENDCVRVSFDTVGGYITSFLDKKSGMEMLDSKRRGVFRFVREDPDVRAADADSAWVVGNHIGITELTDNPKLKWVDHMTSPMRKSLSVKLEFNRSRLEVIYSLDEGSSVLTCDVECDWLEYGTQETYIPQLQFMIPLGYEIKEYMYDIPFGIIRRTSTDLDQPGLSFIYGAPVNENTPGMMLWTDATYGYRGTDASIAATLIRSPFYPDPYPEYGIHKFSMKLSPLPSMGNTLLNAAYAYAHPISSISCRAHAGELPTTGSFMEIIKGSCVLSCVKMAEDGSGLIIRLYETLGNSGQVVVKLDKNPANVGFVDIMEENLPGQVDILGNEVSFISRPNAIHSIKIRF